MRKLLIVIPLFLIGLIITAMIAWQLMTTYEILMPPAINSPYADLVPTAIKNGILNQDETWSGVVQVTGNIIIPQGVTLTIEPGTIIRFAHNREDESSLRITNYFDWPKPALYVYGTLKSIGSPEDLIIFTSDAPEPRGADWRGIIICANSSNPEDKSIIKYTIIEYAHKSIMFALGQELHHIVENNIIRFADQLFRKEPCIFDLFICFGNPELEGGSGITYWDGSSPIIRGNIIYGNTFALEVSGERTPIFENNLLCFNKKLGEYPGGANGVRVGGNENNPNLNYSPLFRNNLVCGNWLGIEFNWGSKAVIENNIIIWNYAGLVIIQEDPNEIESLPNASFNNVWGNDMDYSHEIHGDWHSVPAERFGNNNVAIDPLFTEEDFYNANFNFTQLGLKDSGNPDLFDEDGSRSDIGPNWNWSWVSPDILTKR